MAASRQEAKLLERMEEVAGNAAVEFTDAYYAALGQDRTHLEDFYAPLKVDSEGRTEPQILWQGHIFDNPIEFRRTVQEEFPFTFYHVDGSDSQVLNLKYYQDDRAGQFGPDTNISFLVSVSGYVRLNERSTGPINEFSESFVLIPNANKSNQKRKWLIQNQVCRLVAEHAAGTQFVPGKDMEVE